jgi:hypothetical protein
MIQTSLEEGYGVLGKVGRLVGRAKKGWGRILQIFEVGILSHSTKQRFRQSASSESGS